MAEGTKLVLVFETVNDTKTVFTFPYAKPSVETSAVKTLINTIIANNDIFEDAPFKCISAKTVITSENTIDLSE